MNKVIVSGTAYCLWDSLPPQLSDSELTLFGFRRLPKTHLFCWDWEPHHTDCWLYSAL